jgi:transcriptional regulator with XRE-family HTH domain
MAPMESLLAYLREHQLSHRQLGDLLEISPSYATKLINGMQAPSLVVLRRMHKLLSVPIEKLLDEAIAVGEDE